MQTVKAVYGDVNEFYRYISAKREIAKYIKDKDRSVAPYVMDKLGIKPDAFETVKLIAKQCCK